MTPKEHAWTFPEEVKAWSEPTGWLKYAGVYAASAKHKVLRFEMPIKRDTDVPGCTFEIIADHELLHYVQVGYSQSFKRGDTYRLHVTIEKP